MPQSDPIQGATFLPLWTETYQIPDTLAAMYNFTIERTLMSFPDKTTLEAVWPNARDGIHAWVDGEKCAYVRSSGTWQVLWCEKPFVDVRATAVQSMTSGAETVMQYSTADENTGGMWDPVQPDRITCTRAGVYLVSFTASFAPTTAGSRIMVLRRNGATVRSFVVGGAGIALSGMFALPVRMAVGDRLQVNQFQSSGSTITTYTQAYPQLSAAML